MSDSMLMQLFSQASFGQELEILAITEIENLPPEQLPVFANALATAVGEILNAVQLDEMTVPLYPTKFIEPVLKIFKMLTAQMERVEDAAQNQKQNKKGNTNEN